MEYEMVGWPEDGPTLDLDHREFSYAGKFVMSNTGKAVARADASGSCGDGEGSGGEGGEPATVSDGEGESKLVGAIAFNEDRTDSATAWLRYVTVRRDRCGEGIGSRLARFAADRLDERGYDRVKIAVNNPFAYYALYKAGFGYTGEQTGLAELVLSRPGDRSSERYRAGLDVYRERDDLAPEEEEFLAAKADAGPPDELVVPAE